MQSTLEHAELQPQAAPEHADDRPPSTSASDDLLESFLHWKGSMFDFARHCGLTIFTLLAWWKSEETQAAVNALQELADARRQVLARLHAPAAIETAAEVSQSPEATPPERRRAAALVLRHSTKTEKRESASPSLREGAGGRESQPSESPATPDAPLSSSLSESARRSESEPSEPVTHAPAHGNIPSQDERAHASASLSPDKQRQPHAEPTASAA